jgi:hypothetical protein
LNKVRAFTSEESQSVPTAARPPKCRKHAHEKCASRSVSTQCAFARHAIQQVVMSTKCAHTSHSFWWKKNASYISRLVRVGSKFSNLLSWRVTCRTFSTLELCDSVEISTSDNLAQQRSENRRNGVSVCGQCAVGRARRNTCTETCMDCCVFDRHADTLQRAAPAPEKAVFLLLMTETCSRVNIICINKYTCRHTSTCETQNIV